MTQRGIVPVEAPRSEPTSCFLCTAPLPTTHKDGCDAYLGGLLHGILAMSGGTRPDLCVEHETQFRKLLVVRCQDRTTFERLGIPYMGQPSPRST